MARVPCSLAVGERGVSEAGEEADEEDSSRGHAGTDEADVDFDVGPHCDVNILPSWIEGVGAELENGAKAEDADNRDAADIKVSVQLLTYIVRSCPSL